MNFKLKALRFRLFLKEYNYEWKFKLYWGLPFLVFLIGLDWLSKGLIVSNMQINDNDTKIFIPGIVSLKYAINLGSAFGTNNSSEKLASTIVLASFFTFFILFFLIFVNSKKWVFPSVIMFSGAFANLVARSWAPANENGIYGGVVDMFVWEFSFLGSNGYIFNLADMWVNIAIGIGVICFFWELITVFTEHKRKQKENIDEVTN